MSYKKPIHTEELAASRIKREHLEVGHLLQQLNGYQWEPQHREAFEQKLQLKNDLTNLYWDQKMALEQLGNPKKTNEAQVTIENLTDRMVALEQQVEEYAQCLA